LKIREGNRVGGIGKKPPVVKGKQGSSSGKEKLQPNNERNRLGRSRRELIFTVWKKDPSSKAIMICEAV